MDLKQFGASIKAKYPEYQSYADEEIGQRMLEKYPQYKAQVKTPEPTILDRVKQVGETIAPQTTKTITEGPARLDKYAKSLPNAKGNFVQGVQNAANQTAELARTTLHPGQVMEIAEAALMQELGPAIMGKLFGGMKFGGKILKYPTKKLAAKGTEKAASEATKAGASTEWDALSKQIKNEVYKKLGNTAEVRQAVDKIIASYVPPLASAGKENTAKVPLNFVGKVIDTIKKGTQFKRMGGVKPGEKGPPGFLKEILPKNTTSTYNGPLRDPTPFSLDSLMTTPAKLTPEELLNWRRQILAREGSGIMELIKGSDIDKKVSGIARQEFSKSLHKIAPKTKDIDKIYSLYSKGGILSGGIPEKLAKLGIASLLYSQRGNILGPIFKEFAKDQ